MDFQVCFNIKYSKIFEIRAQYNFTISFNKFFFITLGQLGIVEQGPRLWTVCVHNPLNIWQKEHIELKFTRAYIYVIFDLTIVEDLFKNHP